MNHHEYPIMPTQQAIIGALDIYVEGRKRDCVPQMLAGFSVLRSATEEQVHTAMPFVQASQQLSIVELQDVLAKWTWT
jgi:hypothetical protein